MPNLLNIILFLLISLVGTTQDFYPKDYFRSPVDIPIMLAGNFGEIRAGHFHAGLDIKTEGVEGKNIYAAADGYVARIKISHGGYGKALYLNHPNGYSTTYAHLKNFSPELEAAIKKAQYQKKSYEIELFFSSEEFVVKKGEVIAKSGNTGGSGGPHLHFEIRETEGEIPVNPIHFGFDIKDNVKPIIKKLGIYPLEGGTINGSSESQLIDVKETNGIYRLQIDSTLNAWGKIGLGIEVIDKFTGSNNRCGAFSIELMIDSSSVYCHEMNKIGFHETRYINSHVCYEHWKKDNARIQRSFIQPNNLLDVYNCDKANHNFIFNDSSKHLFTYIIRDANMNTSILSFEIKSDTSAISKTINLDTKTQSVSFKHNEPNVFKNEEVKIDLPSNILYDDLLFQYKKSPAMGRAITPIHHIHNTYTPLHSHMNLSLKIDSLNPKYKEKALIVALNEDLEFLAAEGGTIDSNWITIKTRSLGPYTVMIDSVAPEIIPINISKNQDMSKKWSIMMKISDDLSGIKTYEGYIDNEWVLFEYDYKKDRLTYMFDDLKTRKGNNHELRLIVSDKQNNISEYSTTFFW